MSATDLPSILTNPGRLCFSPTDLSAAFPHGGTAIGATRECLCTSVQDRTQLRDEAFGREVKDILWTGENWALAFVLRQWDDDALGLLFPNTSTGTVSQRKVVAAPGSIRPGYLLSNVAVKVLFSPLDPARVPAVLFYKAVPMVKATLDLQLKLAERFEVGAVFAAIRDSSDRVHKIGRLKDLSL